MSKFAKGKSWIENRLAGDLELDGVHYIVNLVARKGTGVQGYRMTVDFVPHDGSAGVSRELGNASSTADVHRAVRELEGDTARLSELWRSA